VTIQGIKDSAADPTGTKAATPPGTEVVAMYVVCAHDHPHWHPEVVCARREDAVTYIETMSPEGDGYEDIGGLSTVPVVLTLPAPGTLYSARGEVRLDGRDREPRRDWHTAFPGITPAAPPLGQTASTVRPGQRRLDGRGVRLGPGERAERGGRLDGPGPAPSQRRGRPPAALPGR
jgi:hypothetical protein